jgi:hypothetical protein
MRIFLKIGLLCRKYSCKENWMSTRESTGWNIILEPKKERAKCGTDGRIVTGTFCGRMNSCPSDMLVFLR